MIRCETCGTEYTDRCDRCGAERSEAPTALDITKDNCYEEGAAGSSLCPRRGSMLLERRGGGVTVVLTNCNSWRCLGCRDRNMNRFRAIVSSGVSTLGRSSFITITYKAGVDRLRVAGCVGRDWKALWRLVRRSDPWTQNLKWLRVMEVTKKGVPHFHLVVGTIPEGKSSNCWGSSLEIGKYRERMERCDCVAHTFGRAWSAVNAGESYIVHAIEVKNGPGAGAYMAKYMGKEFEWIGETGMQRKFSKSRGWPSDPRIRLEGSLELNGWRRRQWTGGTVKDFEKLEEKLSVRAGERRRTSKQVVEAGEAARNRFIRAGRELIG